MNELKTALAELQEQFGDSIMLLSQQEVKPQPIIPTGSFSLDKALGIGGLPIGKISEVFGETGCLDENTNLNFHCLDSKGEVFNDKGGTIKRLYERFHGLNKHHLQKKAASFTVPSVDENNLVFHNKVHDVVESGRQECFELKSKNGFQIIATADHKFLTPTGYKPLLDLKENDMVFVHNNTYKKRKQKQSRRREWYVKYHPTENWKTITANNRAGEQVYSYKRCRLPVSHAIFEAHKNNLKPKKYKKILNTANKSKINKLWFVKKGQHIHHKDGNHKNNSLENLKLMSGKNHNRMHTNQRRRKVKIVAVQDKIVSIKSVGIRNTYDIKCYAPHNNFVANKFVVHNSGKTTLALSVIAQAQKKGHNCAFIDTEHVLDLHRAKKIGVDLDRLVFSQPDYGEQALEMVDGLCRTGMIKVIVVDSVAALTPKAEIEGDMGDSPMASQARLMGQAMRKLVAVVNKMDVVLLFTNQVRSKISTFGYGGKVTTGGNSLKFYCSIRLDMRKKKEITENDKVIASEHTIKIRKNKFAPPFKIIKTQIGERGFEWGAEVLNETLKKGIVHRAGAYYKYEDDTIGQGKAATIREIESNKKLAEKLIAILEQE